MIERALALVAGLMGAAGVGLAASAAHSAAGSGLESASQMLLFHAVAVLATISLLGRGLLWRPALLTALAAWVVGGSVFAGDIATRAFAGHRLFPMAAPTGGSLLILAWLALAVAATVALVQSRRH